MRSTWQDPGPPGGYQLALPGLTPITKALLWINSGIFLLLLLLGAVGGPGAQVPVLRALGLDVGAWVSYFPFVPLWQVVTYGFVHEDPFHLLFNLLTIYFFGTMVEGIVGSRRFAATYLAGMVLGAFVQLALLGVMRPLVYGASGGAMCILVAAAALRPHTRVIFILFPLTLKTLALIFVGLDLVRLVQGTSGTAWAVHLAGAGYGFAAVKLHWIWRDPLEAWRERRERSAVRDREQDSRRMDELLEKIHREGIQSLSRGDKAFLERMSRSNRGGR